MIPQSNVIFRSSSLLILSILTIVGLFHARSFAQTEPKGKPATKIWFIARVVDTDPFTVEVVDDWYRHQESRKGSSEYGVGVGVNPQSQLENVRDFKVGDFLSGEFCHPWLLNCGPHRSIAKPSVERIAGYGIALPPNVAINLKKLPDEYKAKYKAKGFLLSYKPHKDNIIRSISIHRDGTMFLESYSGGLRRRLAENELKMLERSFFESGIDKLQSSKSGDYFKLELATIFDNRYKSVSIDYGSKESESFTDPLDRLIENQMRTANYRITYRWRFKIKEWEYGDILPLDLAAAPQSLLNRSQLAGIVAPQGFFEEAKEHQGEVNKFFYRFKGKLYYFSFGSCTDSPTGSWACHRAAEVGSPRLGGGTYMRYEEWPESLTTRLVAIPMDALMTSNDRFGKGYAISKTDFEKHRDFFSKLFVSGKNFKEGEYIYADLKVWFN